MCTYVRSFEVLVFFCTVFYSVQLVLFSIRCLRMVFSGLREGKDSLLPPLQKEQRANRSMSGRRRAYCKQSRRHEVPSALQRDWHDCPSSWNWPGLKSDLRNTYGD